MDNQVSIAIIGCGRVAAHQANLVNKMPYARVVAFCDMLEDKASSLAKLYNLPHYTNYHTMIKTHPEIDVLYIATPSGMHFEHMQDVISRYKKHVIIEKPMVMTIEQGDAIKALAERYEVNIFPVFQNRYNKAVQRVKYAVENNELGEIVMASVRIWWYRPQKYYDRDPWRGTFALDGGAMTNQGVHFIDLLRYLVGDARKVSSSLCTKGVDIEVENIAVGLLRFKNGALGTIEITTAAYPKDFEASLSIVGSKGTAIIGGIATNKLLVFTPDSGQESVYSEEFPTIYGFGHIEVFKRAAEYLMNKKSNIPTLFDDAMGTIKLLHALYRSDEIGDWVLTDGECSSSRLGRADDTLSKLYRTKYPDD